jgi:hypothetical protein
MKKLIIALTVSVFALAGVHASDTKPVTDKDKAACAQKAACCDKTKSACCGEKTACSKTPSKGVAMSPKAIEQSSR